MSRSNDPFSSSSRPKAGVAVGAGTKTVEVGVGLITVALTGVPDEVDVDAGTPTEVAVCTGAIDVAVAGLAAVGSSSSLPLPHAIDATSIDPKMLIYIKRRNRLFPVTTIAFLKLTSTVKCANLRQFPAVQSGLHPG